MFIEPSIFPFLENYIMLIFMLPIFVFVDIIGLVIISYQIFFLGILTYKKVT